MKERKQVRYAGLAGFPGACVPHRRTMRPGLEDGAADAPTGAGGSARTGRRGPRPTPGLRPWPNALRTDTGFDVVNGCPAAFTAATAICAIIPSSAFCGDLARATQILEGTNEVMRLIVSRDMCLGN